MDIIPPGAEMKSVIAKHLSTIFSKEIVKLHWHDLIWSLHTLIEANTTN